MRPLPSATRRALRDEAEAALVAGDLAAAERLLGRIYGKCGGGLSPATRFDVLGVLAAVYEKDVPLALSRIRVEE